MKNTIINKLEHSSMLLLHKGKRILFDPGAFTKQGVDLENIDILIITHLHGDHYNEDNIQYIIKNNPGLSIITNSEVATKLKEANIEAQVVEGSDIVEIDGIVIEAHDQRHEEIFEEFGQVQNTGYYIDDVFFHPGDAFTSPRKAVKSVATVIIAPFMRAKMAINYINANPEAIHIGVHDAIGNEFFKGFVKNIITQNIDKNIKYEHPQNGKLTVTL